MLENPQQPERMMKQIFDCTFDQSANESHTMTKTTAGTQEAMRTLQWGGEKQIMPGISQVKS